ncbi:MAG: outer membrane beta-barrel protein [Melioribacteraceae bacterium]|jgi:opacity protein-like surface antigen|nr:outer membrane beta-barrel protein [Melioribacteraceae bacterium]
MKKLSLILLSLFLLSGTAFSQSIGVFVGYGSSAFGDDFFGEDSEVEQAKYLPLGAQLLFGSGGAFEFGAEVNYALVPFTFETEGFGDTKINQLYYGALAKFKIGSGAGLVPYVRGGAGLYTGTVEIDFNEEWEAFGLEDTDLDLKSAFGFNVGAGAEMNLSNSGGLFAEFVYHIVEREFDAEDTEMEENEPFGANNWALHIGFRFAL